MELLKLVIAARDEIDASDSCTIIKKLEYIDRFGLVWSVKNFLSIPHLVYVSWSTFS